MAKNSASLTCWVSRGLSFISDPTGPRGKRADPATVKLWVRVIGPAERIRVATSDFIWNGGDDMPAVASTDRTDAGIDIDLFVAYFAKNSPLRPGPQDRISRK